jgi:hypothetical protein
VNAAHQSGFALCPLMFAIVLLSSSCSVAQPSVFELAGMTEESLLAQEAPSSQQPAQTPQPTPPQARTPQPAQVPCLQPARIFIAEEYTGPFKKVVSYFARKPEIKTVYVNRRYTGSPICPLAPSQKFTLFVHNSVHPVTFVLATWDAGLAQAADDDTTFGQGAEGYGRRYGAALADRVSNDFFHTFVFPVAFRQDPRYYRQGYGSGHSRLRHAVTHVFVARSDRGGTMFNYSEWLGTASAVALSNTYHPGHERGFGPASVHVAIDIGTDAGIDVLREFWPEIVRAFKLPFRIENGANGH